LRDSGIALAGSSGSVFIVSAGWRFFQLNSVQGRSKSMIQLYTWGTPNGKKVSIMLEEIGMPYEVHPINIGQGDQMKPEYLAINPNNKIPSIIDPDGPGGKPFTLFESGAILLYLAEKSGKLWPADLRQRYIVIQWLMFQMGGVGPMFGQANYFYRLEEKNLQAIDRFKKEALRLYNVLNQALGEREYLAGEYSLADIATYPWVGRHEGHHVKLEEFPHVKRWFDKLSQRPAVQRGMEIPKK
jgi:GSH-dependent disulfide-bond oxidoreductase